MSAIIHSPRGRCESKTSTCQMCGDCGAMPGFGFNDLGRIRPSGWSAARFGYADRDSQRSRRYRPADGSVKWFGHGARAPNGHVARIAAARSADDRRFALYRSSAGRRLSWRAGIRLLYGLTGTVQLRASATFGVFAFGRVLRRVNRCSNPGPSSDAACCAASAEVSQAAAPDNHTDIRRNAENGRNTEPCGDRANPVVEPTYRKRFGYHVT